MSRGVWRRSGNLGGVSRKKAPDHTESYMGRRREPRPVSYLGRRATKAVKTEDIPEKKDRRARR